MLLKNSYYTYCILNKTVSEEEIFSNKSKIKNNLFKEILTTCGLGIYNEAVYNSVYIV